MSFMLKPLENLPGFSNAATKYIYELHEGSSGDAGLLSVKGANLCEANRLGYLVPPAFILTTEAATKYSQEDKGQLDSNLVLEIAASIEKLEFATGHKFGSTEGRVPLLLTIRGGSSFSTENIVGTEEKDLSISTINNEMMDVLGAPDSWCIPGVKESCLGIGLTDRVASHLATLTSTTFAYNAYAHFLIRFGTLVLGIPRSRYRKILNDFTSSTGKTNDQLNEDEVWQIYAMFRQITDLPQDPFVQLQMAIKAMYEAWFHTDAALYRQEVLGMSLDTGLALIVQTLVVGDTGIAFSRNPATGELGAGIYGCVWSKFGTKQSLQAYAGDKSSIYDKLLDMVRNFEAHFRDMVQIEFVVLDSEEIYVLQVLRGRRTPQASVRLAVDLQEEKIISEREAVMRVDARNPSTFRQYDFEAKPDFEVIAHAETASRGVIIGSVAFNAVECLELQAQGQKIILVQLDADHADERVLKLCDGLILMRGGVLSPPATLCRALGKPCVTGVSGIKIGHLGDVPYLEVNSFLHIVKGDIISMNASTGKVYKGACNILPTYRDEYFRDIISWSDKFRKMKVQARVISSCAALDAGHAHECGAEGIGYLSTNFMFTCNEDRLSLIRLILLAKAEEDRKSHINVLEELQQEDFSRIIRAINPSEFLGQKERAYLGVKLLDVSLSTFWSARDINVTALASGMNIQAADIKEAISLYHDNNPEIGLRGCRITALHPEITEMQLRALFKAVHSFPAEMRIKPHIWIPAVSSSHELRGVLRVVDSVYNEVFVTLRIIIYLPEMFDIDCVVICR